MAIDYWKRNPDLPEPQITHEDVDTEVIICVNDVKLTFSFASQAEAEMFIDQYANAYSVTGITELIGWAHQCQRRLFAGIGVLIGHESGYFPSIP